MDRRRFDCNRETVENNLGIKYLNQLQHVEMILVGMLTWRSLEQVHLS